MSRFARRTRSVLLVALLLLGVGMSPAAAADSHAQINGSGSSWAANAMNQWIADVTKQGLQVVFTSQGSAQGRKDFALKSTDYGVSDIAYQGYDPNANDVDDSQGRPFAYLPIVAGGTSFPYHINTAKGRITNLRLSGLTLAKIFTNQITNWNDPAIKADNNGLLLPDLRITPVVHSEGSGSTAQFTAYLAAQYPGIWGPFNRGSATMTEYFPTAGNQKSQSGSDGVMAFITSAAGNGSIGFDEYSYALLAGYPVAKMLNTAGYYTLPNQYNVAVALTAAIINNDPNSPNYLTQDLHKVYVNPEPNTYALSSYSYMIIPTGNNGVETKVSTTAKRQTIAEFLNYAICSGQGEVGPIGYSSLPVNLVTAGFDQIAKLKAADPAVTLNPKPISACNNPTFDPANPTRNKLAELAQANPPQPCDKQGAGPCGSATGPVSGNSTKANPSAAAGGTKTVAGNGAVAAGGTNSSGAAAGIVGPAGPIASASVDPLTGQVVAAGGGSDAGDAGSGSGSAGANGVATVLASSSASEGMNSILWLLTIVFLLAVLVVPVILVRYFMDGGDGRA